MKETLYQLLIQCSFLVQCYFTKIQQLLCECCAKIELLTCFIQCTRVIHGRAMSTNEKKTGEKFTPSTWPVTYEQKEKKTKM